MNERTRFAPREHIWYSARQRTVCITFANPEDAQAWDDAGQPLDDLAVWRAERVKS